MKVYVLIELRNGDGEAFWSHTGIRGVFATEAAAEDARKVLASGNDWDGELGYDIEPFALDEIASR